MIDDFLYRIKKPYHWFKTGIFNGLPAQIKYRFPERQLKIICITGTDGKTTSSTLLYHVLKKSGKKVALVSTVAAFLGDTKIETGFHVTAPQPAQLYAFMRQIVDAGYEYLVLETTSHGIYQSRTWGIKPLIVGLTNIAHEHLDYHLTYDNYLAAKLQLLKKARMAVINADDQSASKVRKLLKKQQTLEYSQSERLPKVIRDIVISKFPEAYNQTNIRLITKIAQLLKITDLEIAKALKSFPGLSGRMEYISNRRRLKLIVDFAHTPQGLEAALATLKKQLPSGSRLIVVFGCAGLRDKAKRPMMTKIAVKLADFVVLTAEDPRTEDVWTIIRQMKEQLTHDHDKLISIADRKAAIEFAMLKLAHGGDTIAVLGKGHETSMCYGKTEYPWSDQAVIREILDKQIKR